MFQPDGIPVDDVPLDDCEIPTYTETKDILQPPGRICPETPDRECMLRHLYATRKRHLVQCLECHAAIAMVRASRRKVESAKRQAIPGAQKRQIPEAFRIHNEMLRREALARRAQREEVRAAEKAARQKDQKAKAAEAARLKAERTRLHMAESSLKLAAAGQKTPKQVEAVVIALRSWIDDAKATEGVKLKYFQRSYNAVKGVSRMNTGGQMARLMRYYGFSLESRPEGKGRNFMFLLMNDFARQFVKDGYVPFALTRRR